jgi:hypothetical protein
MTLSKPSKKLALRIMSEVNFDQRIEGFRLWERAGVLPVRLYSFSEVVGFLADPFPRIDFHALADWIRDVMIDPELSKMVNEIIAADAADLDRAKQIRDLMGIRLEQSKKIV